MRLTGEAGAATAKIRDIMERQVNHLARLVDDLLEMSRITRGVLELRRDRVELSAILRHAVETSQPLIEAARHQLDVSLPDEALWLDGDPVRLAQILSNLLNNAAKYTPPGGDIALSARREGPLAEISVRDNGSGIPAEALSRIFEMFNREIRPNAGGQGGLGVGLTLSRRLAEMHGGTVEARSEGEGRGSEFIVRLPLAAGAPEVGGGPAARPRSARPDAPAGGRRQPRRGREHGDVARGARRRGAAGPRRPLRDRGLRRQRAGRRAAGHRHAPHGRLRGGAHAAGPFPDRRAVLVALTGWGQEEDRRRARESGFDHHLVKPVDVEALQRLLSEIDRPD